MWKRRTERTVQWGKNLVWHAVHGTPIEGWATTTYQTLLLYSHRNRVSRKACVFGVWTLFQLHTPKTLYAKKTCHCYISWQISGVFVLSKWCWVSPKLTLTVCLYSMLCWCVPTGSESWSVVCSGSHIFISRGNWICKCPNLSLHCVTHTLTWMEEIQHLWILNCSLRWPSLILFQYSILCLKLITHQVVLLVVQTANFVSVKDNLEYRRGANYNRSTSDDGINLKHRWTITTTEATTFVPSH